MYKLFEKVTLLEPNEYFVQQIKKRYEDLGYNNYEIVQKYFQDYVCTQKYDLILISHVLYHIDQNERENFIDKAYHCLKPEGILHISMIKVEGGQSKIINKFSMKNATSENVKNYCKKKERSCETTPENVSFRYNSGNIAKDFEDSFSFANFLVIEDSFTKEYYDNLKNHEIHLLEKEIRNHVWSLHQKDGSFLLIMEHEFVDIFKSEEKSEL